MPWPTEILAWWRNVFQVAAWVFAMLAAVTGIAAWAMGARIEGRRSGAETLLRHETERLRQRLLPRAVPAAQRPQIVAVLSRTKSDLRIQHPVDAEAGVLADRLAEVIAEAGWRVRKEAVISFSPVVGLGIDVKHPERPPTAATMLQTALAPSFGAVPLRPDPQLGESDVVFVVGSRPVEQTPSAR
jgi:hypothetical protein